MGDRRSLCIVNEGMKAGVCVCLVSVGGCACISGLYEPLLNQIMFSDCTYSYFVGDMLLDSYIRHRIRYGSVGGGVEPPLNQTMFSRILRQRSGFLLMSVPRYRDSVRGGGVCC